MPESGERFEGLIPPVVPAPTFAIRKRASLVYTLDRYVADRILTPAQAAYLAQAVRERLNIVIAGGHLQPARPRSPTRCSTRWRAPATAC